MKSKVTIYDIAEKLGVSVGTVNRAMHDKPKVSRETRELVLRTAEEMGFRGNKVARSLSRNMIKIGVLFEATVHNYLNEVAAGARYAFEELEDYKVTGDIFITRSPFPAKVQELGEKLKQYVECKYDGIILSVVSRTMASLEAYLPEQAPVLAMVANDLPESRRFFCVRPNGRIAGGLAAELLYYMAGRRPVAVFTGNKETQIHRETVDGFMMEAKARSLDIAGIYENQDDPDIAYYATGKLLMEYPEIGGIYVNSSNSETVCKKLKESGMAGKVSLVTSDLFPELKKYIDDGTVQASIFQDPFQQGRLAVKHLYRHITQEEKTEGEILVDPQIILKSNSELFYKKQAIYDNYR